jgi:hypothetical protein
VASVDTPSRDTIPLNSLINKKDRYTILRALLFIILVNYKLKLIQNLDICEYYKQRENLFHCTWYFLKSFSPGFLGVGYSNQYSVTKIMNVLLRCFDLIVPLCFGCGNLILSGSTEMVKNVYKIPLAITYCRNFKRNYAH